MRNLSLEELIILVDALTNSEMAYDAYSYELRVQVKAFQKVVALKGKLSRQIEKMLAERTTKRKRPKTGC